MIIHKNYRNSIELSECKNFCDKTLGDTSHINNNWLEMYKTYMDYDHRVVKVYSIKNKKIKMEYLGEDFILLNDRIKLLGLDIKILKTIIGEFSDIFSKSLLFKHKYCKDNEIFAHNDFLSHNLIYSHNFGVKLIDPDAFRITSLNNLKYISRYVEGLYSLKEICNLKICGFRYDLP